MNERNRTLLSRWADDAQTLEALKETLLSSVDANNLAGGNKTNEQLGEEARALLQARELVSKGIDKVKTLQTPKVGKNKTILPI